MEARPRLLLIGHHPAHLNGAVHGADVEVTPADPGEVARRLEHGRFAAVLAAPDVVAGLLDRFRRDELVITHIDAGLATLDPDGTVTWANAVFRGCCPSGDDPVGRPLLDALGVRILAAEHPAADAPTPPPDPLAPARAGRPTHLRLHRPDQPAHPHLDIEVRPTFAADGRVGRLVARVRDVTAEVTQQQKLDALHAAGRELAGLDADQLAEMNLPTRVELLRQNLRKSIRDLLKYDTIEVRVLDRKTGELNPLLADGMTREAAGRVLYARRTGNGVTGYVAWSGQSYLCHDTQSDPLYIRGAEGARSSMTVPLKFHDEVIGTLNVESPRPNAFTADDLQFAELFSKETAAALHTLDLLSAQQGCTVSQLVEAVNKEIALPIDDVLGSASVLLARFADDPDAAGRLRQILDGTRQVKAAVSKVGREMAPRPPAAPGEAAAHAGPPPLAGKRVLVVDPDPQTRRQAHLLLARLGALAETAGTAADALALAADNPYDAVFLDVKPPDLGGYESYRRLRAARPAAVLAMTTGFGYDVAHSIVKARQDGLKYVLFKPFRHDQVVKAVLDNAPAPPTGLIGSA